MAGINPNAFDCEIAFDTALDVAKLDYFNCLAAGQLTPDICLAQWWASLFEITNSYANCRNKGNPDKINVCIRNYLLGIDYIYKLLRGKFITLDEAKVLFGQAYQDYQDCIKNATGKFSRWRPSIKNIYDPISYPPLPAYPVPVQPPMPQPQPPDPTPKGPGTVPRPKIVPPKNDFFPYPLGPIIPTIIDAFPPITTMPPPGVYHPVVPMPLLVSNFVGPIPQPPTPTPKIYPGPRAPWGPLIIGLFDWGLGQDVGALTDTTPRPKGDWKHPNNFPPMRMYPPLTGQIIDYLDSKFPNPNPNDIGRSVSPPSIKDVTDGYIPPPTLDQLFPDFQPQSGNYPDLNNPGSYIGPVQTNQ